MDIKVLGPGCANCVKLERLVTEAATEIGISDPVIKVSDIKEIMSYGIMATPGLVVDGKLKSSGRIPSKDEIKKYLLGGTETGPGDCSCGCNGESCC